MSEITLGIIGGGQLGSMLAISAKKLNIKVGETTFDEKFTLHREECLAACTEAPMMRVNDTYYGNLTEQRIDQIIDSLD